MVQFPPTDFSMPQVTQSCVNRDVHVRMHKYKGEHGAFPLRVLNEYHLAETDAGTIDCSGRERDKD